MTERRYPICSQKKGDCMFRGTGGYCLILEDTLFDRDCPFYKDIPVDLKAVISIPGFDGLFKYVRGFGGKYLVSNKGEVVNRHGRLISKRVKLDGKDAVSLSYLEHYMAVSAKDLVKETFGRE